MNPDDEAAAAATDVLYLHALAGAVIGKLGHRFDRAEIADRFLKTGAVEYSIDIYLEPWPADDAEEMVADWRDAPGPGSVRASVVEVA
jgi:hypothetical protein